MSEPATTPVVIPTPIDRAAQAIGLALALWLFGAAATSPFELFDSWDAIGNARFLVGWDGGGFESFRGSLWSMLFVPVELARRGLEVPSVDARPFRLLVAALHVGTFVACWQLLKRWHPLGRGAVLIAATLASLNVVVGLYAPYRSVDLLPAALLLSMTLLAWRAGQHRGPRALVGLFVIGAVGALAKPVLGGLLWFSAFAVFAVTADRALAGGRARRFGSLVLCAAAGALVYWLIRAALLSSSHEGAFFMLPLDAIRIQAVDAYEVRGHHYSFSTWFRNIWAWGGAASLLFLLGIRGAWQHGGASRAALVAWVTFCALTLSNKIAEVRYLMPLVPLTAWVAAHGVGELRRPLLRALVALVALVDLAGFAWTASGAFSPLTRPGAGPSALVARLEAAGGPVVVAGRPSWALERAPPLLGDPYHGLTEARPRHVALWLDRPMHACEARRSTILSILRSGEGRVVWTTSPLHHLPSYLSAEQIDAYQTVIAAPTSMPASSTVLPVDDRVVRLPSSLSAWRYTVLDWPDGETITLTPRGDDVYLTSASLSRSLDDAVLRGVEPVAACDAWGACAP